MRKSHLAKFWPAVGRGIATAIASGSLLTLAMYLVSVWKPLFVWKLLLILSAWILVIASLRIAKLAYRADPGGWWEYLVRVAVSTVCALFIGPWAKLCYWLLGLLTKPQPAPDADQFVAIMFGTGLVLPTFFALGIAVTQGRKSPGTAANPQAGESIARQPSNQRDQRRSATSLEEHDDVAKLRKLGVLPPLAALLLTALLFISAQRLAGPYLGASNLVAVPIGFGVLLTLFFGWLGWRIVQTYIGVPKRRPVDVTHLHTPPSPQIQPTVDTLAKLDFKRLGETRTQLPFGEPGVTWVLIDPQATVVAEVVESDPNAMLLFSTAYNDEAVVETAYPTGERVKTANFRSHTITTSVQDAYVYHREQVADFSTEHGHPSRIEHMASYLRCDAVYRLRYARRRLRRYLWAGGAQLAALGYMLVTLLAFISLSLIDPSSEFVVQRYWRMVLQLTLATLISGLAFAVLRWHESLNRRAKEAPRGMR